MARVDLFYPSYTSTFENLTYPANPPLGLMHLAAVLREAGHTCRVTDLKLSRDPEGVLTRQWEACKPDLVGISCVTQMARNAYALVDRCARSLPGVPVIIGGPHVTAYREDVLRECAADVAVRGEGEPVIARLVESLLAGALDRGLPNIIHRQGDDIVMNEGLLRVKDLNALPAPAWDLVDIGAYSRQQSCSALPNRRYASISSSRGCPYTCTYCHNVFGKEVRFLAVERFVDQLEHIHRTYRVRHFEILDDIFNIDRERVLAICGEILRRGIRIRMAFPNGLRADLLDREVTDALFEAGTRFICFPIESASPRIRKLARKNLDLEKATVAIDYAESKGIVGCGFFMLGFPTETEEEMRQTIDFAVGSKLLVAFFHLVTPYKGAEMWETFAANRASRVDYAALSYDYGVASVSDVPMKTIERIRSDGIRRFYSRPSRIARLVRIYPMPHKVPLTAAVAILRILRRRMIQGVDATRPC